MPRWEGDAAGRLERAALELFAEQGYERTTVAGIARRAGLTERSFYRWYADKREVLFAEDELTAVLHAALAAVPRDVPALPALVAAFGAAPQVLRPKEMLRTRAAVIDATPPLRERELNKLASLSAALVDALLERGAPADELRFAVDIGMVLLRTATARWVLDDGAEFAVELARAAEGLRTVSAALDEPATSVAAAGAGSHPLT